MERFLLDVLGYLLPLVPIPLLSAQNNSGSTPLHWAAVNSRLDVSKALVEFPNGPGVNLIDVKNAAGHSPLAEAELAGWDEGAKWFVEVMNLDSEEVAKEEGEPDAASQNTDATVNCGRRVHAPSHEGKDLDVTHAPDGFRQVNDGVVDVIQYVA